MNQYLPQELIDKAYFIDKWMGGRVLTLIKFAITGTVEDAAYQQLTYFLDQEGIAYDTNGSSLIWLGVLDAGIAKLLKQLK